MGRKNLYHVVYAAPWIPDAFRVHWREKFGEEMGPCGDMGVISDVEISPNFTGLAYDGACYHGMVRGRSVATGLLGRSDPLFRGVLVRMATVHERAAMYLHSEGYLRPEQMGEFCGTDNRTVWDRIRDALMRYCDGAMMVANVVAYYVGEGKAATDPRREAGVHAASKQERALVSSTIARTCSICHQPICDGWCACT